MEYRSIVGLRLRARHNVVKRMKLSTNSGSPYFTRRRRVIDRTLQNIDQQIANGVAVLG